MSKPFEHRMKKRVYYGDSDAGGVVYYGKYLEYVEGGRYEYCLALGIDLAAYQEKGVVFVVVEADGRYRSPARLGDVIEIRTLTRELTLTSLTFESSVWRAPDEELLFTATVRAACIGEDGKPRRIPREIVEVLRPHVVAGTSFSS